MIKMMIGDNITYENTQNVEVYSTDGEMTPTGFALSDDNYKKNE